MWTTLGDALENALASMNMDAGEGAIAVASDAVKLAKSADPEWPASFKGGHARHADGKTTYGSAEGRGRPAHAKASVPPLGAGRPMFSVIEGGVRAGGGIRPDAYRYEPPREKGERMGWKVVG